MAAYSLPDNLLARLISIGTHESFHELREKLTSEEAKFHRQMMTQSWHFWYPIAEQLNHDNLKALIKSLTMAESMLEGWQGGSVSAVIWLYNKYAPPVSEDKDKLTDWILRQTVNAYVPFSNYGAKSLDEYYERRSASLSRKRDAQVKEEMRHQEAVRRHAIAATKDIFPAIARGDIKAVTALIRKGADLAASDSNGFTPLQWAEQCGKKDIVDIIKSANCLQGSSE
jgi:hypothetical protein